MAALESTGVLEAPAEAGCARPGASDGDAGPQREAAEHGGGLLVAAGSQAAVVAALWERHRSWTTAGKLPADLTVRCHTHPTAPVAATLTQTQTLTTDPNPNPSP